MGGVIAVGSLAQRTETDARDSHFYLKSMALGLTGYAVDRILSNAALTNRLYALEQGPHAQRVIELIGRVAESVPEEQQDDVLEYLAQNWDSLTEDFFAACSGNAKKAKNGARHLAENFELSRILHLNNQALPPEVLGGAVELLDVLVGHSSDDNSPRPALDNDDYIRATEVIYQDFPCRYNSVFFWLHQTGQFPDMLRLPEDASLEMTIAALTMHRVGIPYEVYAKALLAADVQRKARNAELSE